jgi:polysaccharide export outer membrane protein
MRLTSILLCLTALAAPLRGQQSQSPVSPTTQTPAQTVSNSSSTYPLRPGDILRVEVWGQQQFSGQFLVDETGHFPYPLLGDLQVTNLTVAQLRERIRQGLDSLFKNPFVAVFPLFRIAVLGEVQHPGLYTVDPTLSVIDVVALAGGATQYGDLHKIRLLRGGGEQQVSFGQGRTLQEIGIRSGDQILVARRSFTRDDLTLLLGLIQVALSAVILVNQVK